MNSPAPSYHGYRFPADIIAHAVWLYFRFSLSFRDVEDLLAQRGIMVTYETIRQWTRTFGRAYARRLRHRRGPILSQVAEETRLSPPPPDHRSAAELSGRAPAGDAIGPPLHGPLREQPRRSVASTNPTARAADAPLQVTRPAATFCVGAWRRPQPLPGRPPPPSIGSPPPTPKPSLRRVGSGDVCLLIEA